MTSASSATPRVLVDCDTGLDDALMLFQLQHHARRGRLVLDAVTAVGGNTPLARAAANTRYVLDRVGASEVPVHAGADRPPEADAALAGREFHGADGLGGIYSEEHGEIAGERAAHEIVRRAAERYCDLLATGPLTNVADALALDPDLPSRVGRLVVMGGAFGRPGGNITPFAEFNFWVDADAANTVLGAGFDCVVVPLDVTEMVFVSTEAAARLPGFAGELASAACVSEPDGRGGFVPHDPVAAATMLDPTLCEYEEVSVVVETAGDRNGQSRIGGDRPTVRIATDVDAARTSHAILGVLGSPA